MVRSPRCYIPSFVGIGLPVLEKVFEGFLQYMRPSPGFWGTGEQEHLIRGNSGTKANFLGEQGNKDNLFQGNKGTVAPPPLGVGGSHIWAWWPSWSCDKHHAPIFHFTAPENFHTKFGSEQHSSF